MPTSEDIASHKLVQQLLDDLKPVFKRLEPERLLRRSKSPVELSPTEFYTWNVFGKVSPIDNAIIRMEHANYLLGTFPNAIGHEKKGITRDKWMEYHLSYFIVILASIPDLCLLLANSIFRLGIPERLCKSELINKNEWVITTDVPKALRALDKIVEKHRNLRNMHIHHGKIPNVSDILDNDLFENLRTISFAQRIKDIGVNRRTITQGYRSTTKELCELIRIDTASVISAVIDVFDVLQVSYISNLERVRKVDAL